MIIAFSGKKQAGKNTGCNFCLGTFMKFNGMLENGFKISPKGKLYITDFYGNKDMNGILDTSMPDADFQEFLRKELYGLCKIYSMADSLKQDVCIDILGLDWKACYGTDEEKDADTHLKWEDMPGVYIDMSLGGAIQQRSKGLFKTLKKQAKLTYHKPGFMSGREVMQFVGTNIFRRMYSNVWINATLNKIKKEESKYALISDVRFPDEVVAVQRAGGIVIRLTKNIVKDNHESETALDDFNGFDFIIENDNIDIPAQNTAITNVLLNCGIINIEKT